MMSIGKHLSDFVGSQIAAHNKLKLRSLLVHFACVNGVNKTNCILQYQNVTLFTRGFAFFCFIVCSTNHLHLINFDFSLLFFLLLCRLFY